MGTYTTVDNAFWTDSQVIDNFTPEDKYFYLYLLTNIHINLSGCFEVSKKQIAQEMGYSTDTVEHLIERFVSVHKVIDYDANTKEILVHRWAKYHWTTSEKYLTALRKKISAVKSERFSSFLNESMSEFIDSDGTVFIPYQYGMDTSVTVTVKDIYNNKSINDSNEGNKSNKGVGEERKEGVEQKSSGSDIKKVVEAWNATRLPKVVRVGINSERGRRLQNRLREYGLVDVLNAVDLAAKSDYLQDQHWFDFGWFVRPENFVKVLEGKYNRNGIRENKRSEFGSGNTAYSEHGSNYGGIRPSLDPDDESTWGVSSG